MVCFEITIVLYDIFQSLMAKRKNQLDLALDFIRSKILTKKFFDEKLLNGD